MQGQLTRNTLFITIGSIGQKMIAFVYFLFVARTMKPEQTGTYFLVTSFVTMFSVFTDLGVMNVLIREIAKTPERTKELAKLGLGIKLVLDIISVCVVIVAANILSYEVSVRHLIYLTTLVMTLDSIGYLFYGVLRGKQQLQFESLGLFLGQLTTTGFGILILTFVPSITLLIAALICGSTVNLIIASSKVIKTYGWSMLVPKLNKVMLKWLLISSLPFAISGACVKVYSYIDTIIISKFLDATSLGVYSVAYKFTYAFQFLPMVFSSALYPRLSALFATDPVRGRETFERSIWYTTILATPIIFGVWLISEPMIRLTGGGYQSSVEILRLLIFVLFPIFWDFPIGALLNASGYQNDKTVSMIAMLVISCTSFFVLIRAFGLYGAALASLINFTSLLIIESYFVKKRFALISFKRLFDIVGRIIGSGLCMLLVGYLIRPFVHWIVLIPLCGIVYACVLLVSRSITIGDVKIIRGILKKTV